MDSHSVIVLEKPLQHLGLSDWQARLTQIRNVAESLRKDAWNLRHTSRTLRNETRIDAEWSNYFTNLSLSERRTEVDRWRTAIKNTLIRLETEIKKLTDEKHETEEEMEAMMTALLVVADCLSARDCRLGSEITYDEADVELKKELCVVENNLKLLRDQCQMTWEKLNHLENVRLELRAEVDHKKDAMEIDTNQLALDKLAASVSFRPDATRNPKNCCTYAGWLQHTKHMKQLVDNELADAYAIREALFVCRQKARNILKAQQERTEHSLRKRVFEIQRARNELEWQKLKMTDEMEKARCEIKSLEKSYADKTNALTLAQTRLENRAQRLGSELCLDEAHDKLIEEVNLMRTIRKILSDKIDCARTTYTALAEHELRVDTDLHNKEHAMMVDMRSLDARKRLRCSKEISQTDQNIQLTKMEKEIPPT